MLLQHGSSDLSKFLFQEKVLIREILGQDHLLLSFYRCFTNALSITLGLNVLKWAVPVFMSPAGLQVSRSGLKSPGWSWAWP